MSPFDLLGPLCDARRVCSALGGPGWLSASEAQLALARVLAFVEQEVARVHGQLSVSQTVPAPHPRAALLILTTDRYHTLLACLAAWCSGCTVVLPPNHQTGTIERVRALSGATLLLADTTIADCLASAPSGSSDRGKPVLQVPPIQAEQHVLTAFTSGTTGDHQACPKTAGQLFGEALTLGHALGFDTTRIVAATVPSHHLYGLLFGVLVPFFHGAAFVREPAFQPAEIRNLCERRWVTDLVTVPAHLGALVEAGWNSHFRLDRAFSSGAVLDSELADEFHRVSGARVIDVLGSTESGGIAWRVTEPGAVYVPLPGVEVGVGPDARLMLRSPFLPPGSGWQLMSDRVRLREAGFEHLGRSDGVVKLGAKRIAVQELEARARQLDTVTDAAVLVQPSTPLRGTELWLAVATEHSQWTATSLRQALGRYFDPVVLPRRYRVVPNLPRDALGKIQRERLERLFSPEADEFALLPEVSVTEGASDARLTTSLLVPDESRFFQGHFPGEPVLPGVAQLSEFVLPAIASAWAELGRLERVPSLKYKRPIRPGARLALEVRRARGAASVHFELREDGELCTTGQLCFVVTDARDPSVTPQTPP